MVTPALGIIILLVLMFLFMAIKILNEYERGVIFRLGRIIDHKGPGIILLIPVIDRMVRVSLRTVQRLVAVHSLSSRMAQGRRVVPIGALLTTWIFLADTRLTILYKYRTFHRCSHTACRRVIIDTFSTIGSNKTKWGCA